METVINSRPQSSNITGRDQVDIGEKTKTNEGNCAQFAIGFFKVNGREFPAAHFAV
ncbi:hypothetical protein [Pantoea conspicua]|uniref:hypothetical protein n=1 Tax=Pantoea conspicua TaxID=472705 RepID=UPI00139028C8|nr:hypothetical protein [Pantoea conspicua]